MMNKFLFLIIVLAVGTTVSFANAQQQEQTPPPLEKPTTETETPTIPTLGKITIQISQTEQIIIDLPLKSENKYQVVPIK